MAELKQMTAVEWLIEVYNTQGRILHSQFEQAKEMEKDQLCDMYIQGRKDNHLDYYPEKHAKETYDEMFKKD